MGDGPGGCERAANRILERGTQTAGTGFPQSRMETTMADRNRRARALRTSGSVRRRTRAVRASGAFAKATELGLAAPQVIMLRTARMLAAGPAPGVRDRSEMLRMGTEKMQAAQASMLAMSTQMYKTNVAWMLRASQAWWSAWMLPWSWMRYPGAQRGAPWGSSAPGQQALRRAALQLVDKGLAPVHAAATANLRRLSGKKGR
jgi:hypothetical protein